MIIRTLAIVATMLTLVFVQLIDTAHQPPAARSAAQPATAAAVTSVAEGDQRVLEELAAWPAAAGR
jgi:hypothetical protein